MTVDRSEAARPLATPAGDAPARASGHASPEADSSLDDPYQCAYCGRLTEPAEKRCPHCSRSLLVTVRPSLVAGPSLRTAIFLICILAAVGLLETAPPLFAWLVARGADPAPYRLLLKTPAADLLLGRFLDWPSPVVAALVAIAAGRAAALALCALGLSLRAAPAYSLTLAALVLDLLWNLYRLAGGYLGPAGAIGDLALALAALSMLFASDRDFTAARRRLLVQPDTGLSSGPAYYQRGHEYRRRGMWALAVAHWRLAVGAQPREVQYYKDLAVGYAQIERFDRSLRALEEAARQAPEDAEIAEIMRLVETMREGST